MSDDKPSGDEDQEYYEEKNAAEQEELAESMEKQGKKYCSFCAQYGDHTLYDCEAEKRYCAAKNKKI